MTNKTFEIGYITGQIAILRTFNKSISACLEKHMDALIDTKATAREFDMLVAFSSELTGLIDEATCKVTKTYARLLPDEAGTIPKLSNPRERGVLKNDKRR